MSTTLVLLLTFASCAIVFSFLCSLWESVLLSISPAYAHELEQKGARIGFRLKEFKANIDVPLAAILTLNTIAHTVGAIGVGEQATRLWADSNPLITGVAVPVIMTLAILILSEIIPKTMGANNWQRLAPFTVHSLDLLITVLYPIIWLTQIITKGLRRGDSEPVLSRSQFLTLAEVGEKEGVLDEKESEFIRNLLKFREVQARAVMTPRTVTRMAPESMSIAAFAERFPDGRFSRIPVFEDESPDHITGYVLKDDILEHLSRNEVVPLETLRREMVVVSETEKITEVFEQFLEKREHIALVVDEFGGMLGVITMEDVIETMLGLQIVDEKDRAENMQELARENWRRRAKKLGILTEEPVDEPEVKAGEESQESQR